METNFEIGTLAQL